MYICNVRPVWKEIVYMYTCDDEFAYSKVIMKEYLIKLPAHSFRNLKTLFNSRPAVLFPKMNINVCKLPSSN